MSSQQERHINNFSQLFPPKPHWTAADVPDLSGQTIIVTGGSSGLGKEICKVLLSHNAKVYAAARSEEKGNAAVAELKSSTGKNEIYFLRLDLADLTSVHKAADEFMAKEDSLHVLFNNGGIMFPPAEVVTAQGYDGQFGTNVLGHFFFTKCLLPIFLRTAKAESNPTHKVRVVNTSSNGHELLTVPGGIDWTALGKGDEALKKRKKLGPQKLYGMSKLGNVLFSNELAKRYGKDGVVSIALHPGSVKTELQRYSTSTVDSIINSILAYDISLGIITPLYAGTAEEALSLNGKYLTAWARRSLPSKDAQDPELAKRLWDWCEEQVERF
ncbi:NAD-P-binding protein [Dentipellis sp. KUC8613]|nr:NAD-P-binding protein [Dentipellis sp. KUC8613]